jgi:predicted dehydrogenase
MVKVGVIGVGHWGPNIVRNFIEIDTVESVVVCDLDHAKLAAIKKKHPPIKTVADPRDLVENREIDAIAIATSPETHYDLAKMALGEGKHVLVEKPLAMNSRHALELNDIATENNSVLMVGHIMEYNAAAIRLKELVDRKQLGKLCYAYGRRLNLGLYQRKLNVLWDLGPHDISLALFLLNKMPLNVSAIGRSYFGNSKEDIVFVNMLFEDNILYNLQLSWLDPLKVRKTVIVGSEKMAVFDEFEEQKLRIFDKGVVAQSDFTSFDEWEVAYRLGETKAIVFEEKEPLKTECEHFIDCVERGKQPRSDGRDGFRVVKVLEAIDKSLKSEGKEVKLQQ